jgi:oxygen-independent coproporphyrinogen-3 oxidase
MCQGELNYESIGQAHLIDCKNYFAREVERLADFVDMGLVVINDDGIEVTPQGWYFVRAIAMVFDKNLQVDKDRARFSKII